MNIRIPAIGLLSVLLAACSSGESSPKAPPTLSRPADIAPPPAVKRWYAFQHVTQGAKVFQENCAACHGRTGEGAPEWKKIGADGKYPAPPLNGTGHAWHHPLKVLFHVVKNGSPGGQGGMPSWKEKLTDAEMISAIAWFQSRWPEEIYAAWTQREEASRANDRS
ncbi:MAG: cytochrome c [Gammaproteobacteria bacterium]|nr:cytochrome c [Gammaproteobacteria bacterium]